MHTVRPSSAGPEISSVGAHGQYGGSSARLTEITEVVGDIHGVFLERG